VQPRARPEWLEATRCIPAELGEHSVLVLSSRPFCVNEYVYEAPRAGASGFLSGMSSSSISSRQSGCVPPKRPHRGAAGAFHCVRAGIAGEHVHARADEKSVSREFPTANFGRLRFIGCGFAGQSARERSMASVGEANPAAVDDVAGPDVP
jgi:hypothetical protein